MDFLKKLCFINDLINYFFYYKKFTDITFHLMRPKCAMSIKHERKEEYIDEIHRQGLEFIKIAKEFYVSSLLKKQLKILVELGPNDTSYSSALKNTIVANFTKKATHFHSQKIPFMLLYFMTNVNSYNLKLNLNTEIFLEDYGCKKVVSENFIGEKLLRDEKNEKKSNGEFENKQLYDIFYLLLNGCIKIWEVFLK